MRRRIGQLTAGAWLGRTCRSSWLPHAVWLSSRLLWLGLVGLHIPIAVRTAASLLHDGGTVTAAVNIAVLLAVNILFALKAVDVAALRLPSSRASWLAMVLATAVAHHDALAISDASVPVTAAVVAASPLAGMQVWRRRRWLMRGARLLARAMAQGHASILQRRVLDDRFIAMPAAAALCTDTLRIPRGPPI